jgi:hypothetical protein
MHSHLAAVDNNQVVMQRLNDDLSLTCMHALVRLRHQKAAICNKKLQVYA